MDWSVVLIFLGLSVVWGVLFDGILSVAPYRERMQLRAKNRVYFVLFTVLYWGVYVWGIM